MDPESVAEPGLDLVWTNCKLELIVCLGTQVELALNLPDKAGHICEEFNISHLQILFLINLFAPISIL